MLYKFFSLIYILYIWIILIIKQNKMNLELNKYEKKLVVYALREVGKEAAKKNNELTLMNVSSLLNKMQNKW